MSEFQVAQAAWARTLVKSLADAGVGHFVVSPGSRSTPLVSALLALELAFDVVVDERSAGFFALGRGKLGGFPSVLISTSGSAPGHYFPALIEADESETPLIVLSADRPPELQGNRSFQTIEQRHLFGRKVRWFDDLGPPESGEGALYALRRKAAQAVQCSLHPKPGPVHLNAPFRKPLEPQPTQPSAERVVLAHPVARAFAPRLLPARAAAEALEALCVSKRRPVLVAGPRPPLGGAEARAVFDFARTTGCPLLVEATSNLRHGAAFDAEVAVFDAFDLVGRALASGRAEGACDALKPDLVLQLGGAATSASWLAFTQDVSRVVLGGSGFVDPTNRAELFVTGDLVPVLELAAQKLPRPEETFRERLAAANRLAWQAVRALLDGAETTTSLAAGGERFAHEGRATEALGRQLGAGDLLFVGNSLPVRLLDTFLPAAPRGIQVLSQRGANGIDGLIAGAAGAALGHPGQSVLLLGDISFLHDVGSLALLRELSPRLCVVVFNNHGGRLFEQLPLALGRDPGGLGAWLTPHQHDLGALAGAFGLANYRVGTPAELERALELGRAAAAPTVIEAMIEPSGTSSLYEKLARRLETTLSVETWWRG